MRQIIAILLLFVVGLEAIDLKCRFNFEHFKYVAGNGCRASNVNITSRQTITSVNGRTNFDGSSYEIFIIANQVVNFIPADLGKFFPNLDGLSITGSMLKKVEKKDLQQFPNLIELHLYSNEIKFLPGDLFEGNLELRSFSFDSNPITHVGHNLVTPLKELEAAWFRSTNCMNKSYYFRSLS
jgi:hypothetical protein